MRHVAINIFKKIYSDFKYNLRLNLTHDFKDSIWIIKNVFSPIWNEVMSDDLKNEYDVTGENREHSIEL